MSDMRSITKYVFQARDQLFAALYKSSAYRKIGSLRAEYMYDDEPISLQERSLRPTVAIKTGETWSKKMYGCGWFHFFGTIPSCARGKHIVFLLDVGGEGLIYDGETPICGITDIAPVGKNFHLVKGKKIMEFSKSAVGGEPVDFWVEVGDNNENGKRGRFLRADICISNDATVDRFYDFTMLAMMKPYLPFGSKTRRDMSLALNLSEWLPAKKASNLLHKGMKAGKQDDLTVYATGHGHLDLAFMWPIRETKRKAVRTFINQLNNIKQYDGYIYGSSQPQQFAWMEKEYPALFARLQSAAKQGKLDLQGGMWVECDTNLPSGESLVRQCLYGKRYWQEKFGKEVKTCWLPDCFGFNGNLPQILKKCGIDYFLTIKLSWNDTNKFPYHSFMWQGIDGTKILAHIPPEETYSGEGIPFCTLPAEKIYAEKNVAPLFSMVFGMGDGGAGPSIGHLETVKRHQDITALPHLKFATQEEFFDDLSDFADKLPVWAGELYLEYHRGIYTSQAANKYHNRKIEFLLHNVEFLCALSGVDKKEELDEIWEEVLLYQFHDVLPGSSVRRVYDECIPRYQLLETRLSAMQNEILSAYAGNNLVAFNYTGYADERVLTYQNKTYICSLPAYGSALLRPYSSSCLHKENNLMENEFVSVTIEEDGTFSVFNKETGAAAFRNGRFAVFCDEPKKFDAWNIDYDYLTRPKTTLRGHAAAVQAETGVLTQETVYAFSSSTLKCRLLLREHSKIVEVETDVSWHETHKMLRFLCEPSQWENTVQCDIQFGNIRRSTATESPTEKAQYEICAHKWIDIGQVAYLTEAKYGWRVQDKEVSLALLRSPVHPDPACDRGDHQIRFAFYPHKNGENPAKESYFYNNPPRILENFAEVPSFISTDCENIVIETVKPSEDKKGIIVRLYEDRGKKTSCTLFPSFPYRNIFETDMLERQPVPTVPNLTFLPFETKTLFFEK